MPEAPLKVIAHVEDVLENQLYNVALPNGKIVMAHLSKQAKVAEFQLNKGERVHVEMSVYDMDRARIAWPQEPIPN